MEDAINHLMLVLKREEVAVIIGLACGTMTLWHVPLVRQVLYPFRLFNTFVHELGHGIAATATGGRFKFLIVNPNLSGEAWTAGGNRFVIASSGYLGSMLFGGALIIVTSWKNVTASGVFFCLGVGFGILCVLFVRNRFGLLMSIFLTAGLLAAGVSLDTPWDGFLLLFLAVQATLNALNSLVDLLKATVRKGVGGLENDASVMAEIFPLPAMVWAMVWGVLSLGILVGALNIAYPPG
ncbi:MAG: M50 family metallopeptidase [Chloroflexaceae bacterium]|nr:M50 family metallopeptidase [Chloroflexaceae bacterium]